MGALIGIIVVLVAVPAFAQDEATARRLFDEGLAAARAGDHEAAANAFERSFELFPHPGTLLNVALYQDAAGRRADAVRSFTALLERYGSEVSPETRARVLARLEEIERDGPSPVPPGEPGSPPASPPAVGEGLARSDGEAEPSPDVHPAPPSSAELEETVPLAGGEDPVRVDEAATTDTGSDEQEPPARRRGFWRGPWPWVIAGVVVLGAAVGLTAGLWPEEQTGTVIPMEIR
jgi:hypothetical protein